MLATVSPVEPLISAQFASDLTVSPLRAPVSSVKLPALPVMLMEPAQLVLLHSTLDPLPTDSVFPARILSVSLAMSHPLLTASHACLVTP